MFAARGSGVQNDLSELFFRETEAVSAPVLRNEAVDQDEDLIGKACRGQRGGIEDSMTAMDHMIVERQNHQRGVGDDAAENAGIHGVKVSRFGMDRLTETSDGLIRHEVGVFFGLDI